MLRSQGRKADGFSLRVSRRQNVEFESRGCSETLHFVPNTCRDRPRLVARVDSSSDVLPPRRSQTDRRTSSFRTCPSSHVPLDCSVPVPPASVTAAANSSEHRSTSRGNRPDALTHLQCSADRRESVRRQGTSPTARCQTILDLRGCSGDRCGLCASGSRSTA